MLMSNLVSESVMSEVRGLEAQHSNSVVLLITSEGEVVYMSGRVFASAYDVREKIGRQFHEYIHPDDVAKTYRSMQEALISDTSQPIRIRVRTRDGYHEVDRFSKRLIDEETGGFYLVVVGNKAED
jgi:hypothetical protein